jgi:hypothetical protein
LDALLPRAVGLNPLKQIQFNNAGNSQSISTSCSPHTQATGCAHQSAVQVLSAYQEKIPAWNAIYAHAQDFSASDELLLAILKAFIPQPLNKQQTKVFHMF